jgi:hypothetical protein
MSYDLYLEIDTGGPEPVCVYDWNYTSNCARMWRAAGADLAEFHEKPATECSVILRAALFELENNPATYKAMDPPNGWGSYDSLVPRLTALVEAMERHPKTTVRVWR